MRTILTVLVVLLAETICVAAEDKPLADEIKAIDATVSQEKLSSRLSDDLRNKLRAANRQSTTAWQAIDSLEEWQAFRREKLAALKASLGTSPEPSPLVVRTAGQLQGEGFVVDNLVIEGRGTLITANLYRPATAGEKMPGLLLCHSHHNPKTEAELQTMGMTWARAGCLVLVMDQLGHGERRQHPFRTAADYPAASFRAGRQDYWFRYDVALQLELVGESLPGFMANDLRRGVDVLLEQQGVDPKRIILLGAVAGGGDPAAVAAALDERITAVCPFNFGGPQPESRYPLPEDAAESFGYAGSGSWESTRNLSQSAGEGFLPWMIVGSIAPRKLIYAHEFSWDRERDPVWQRLTTIYGWHSAEDHLAFAHGTGLLTGQSPEASHCNNIGAVHRRHIHAALHKWYGIEVDPAKEYSKTFSAEQLRCLEPALAQDQASALRRYLAERSDQRSAEIQKELDRLDRTQRRTLLKKLWTKSLGEVSPRELVASAAEETKLSNSVRVERLLLEGNIPIPLVLLRPAGDGPFPLVVGVAQQGKQAFLAERSPEIAVLLQRGIAVGLVDVRGTGETAVADRGRDRTSHATSLSASQHMLGGTLLGGQLSDLRSALQHFRSLKNIDAKRIALWGDSFAPLSAADREFAVPHGVERPSEAEPLGGMLVLLTALLDDDLRAVLVNRGLASYRSAFEEPCVYLPHDSVAPGVTMQGDITTLIGGLAPLPLRLSQLTDAQNRLLSEQSYKAEFAEPLRMYKSLGAEENLSLAPLRGEPLVAWLADQLRSEKQ